MSYTPIARPYVLYISRDDRPEVRLAVSAAVRKAGATLTVLGDAKRFDSSSLVAGFLSESKAVVADLSCPTPGMMASLGMAIQAKLPILVITDDWASIPSELSWLQSLAYLTDNFKQLEVQLSESLKRVLEDPAKYFPEKLQEKRFAKKSVFISYAHKDREYLDRLLVHLEPLMREQVIDLWSDSQIRTGDRWREEIKDALNRATIAILIVSADFLASEFIAKNELPPLLDAALKQGTRILPLLAKPSRFTRDKVLGQYQAFNGPGDELINLDEGNQEKLYDKVCGEIELLVRAVPD